MNETLKAIDGTDLRRAPPPKKGLQRAVYRCIEALERATEKQVYEYIPAAITKGSQVVTHKKLSRSLQNGVYCGFYITEGNIFRIAPMSYYNKRKAHIKALPGDSKAKHRASPEDRYAGELNLDHFHDGDIHITISRNTIRVLKAFGLGIVLGCATLAGWLVGRMP